MDICFSTTEKGKANEQIDFILFLQKSNKLEM